MTKEEADQVDVAMADLRNHYEQIIATLQTRIEELQKAIVHGKAMFEKAQK